MIYVIDHQDSFTWNVVHQFEKFDEVFCSNYFSINKKKLEQAQTIVLSPGPGSPKDYPLIKLFEESCTNIFENLSFN